jgi:adenosylmethionine-8-amino-7-oxononanoate aminotransferase
MKQNEIINDSIKYVWHPCSQMHNYDENNLKAIKYAKGSWLFDYDGKKYFDGVSSWWVNIFGHNNSYISKKIKEQLDQFEHVMLAGMTHLPVVELSKKLTQLTNLHHCLYGSDGSNAIEIAIKLSVHYWKNSNQPKKIKFAYLENSYHGETIGALSVTDVSLFRKNYSPLLKKNIVLPSPSANFYKTKKTDKDFAVEQFKKAEKILKANKNELAAVLIEPCVQCAAGMHIYHPIYIRLISELCKQLDIHFIVDEIAVGFGRTGTFFGYQHGGKNIRPDMVCVSKGLTGGYLPLSATIVNEKIYQSFLSDDFKKGFLHSHSYTGNPLACTAANATIDLFTSKHVIKKNIIKSKLFDEILCQLKKFKIKQYQNVGMIWRFNLPEKIDKQEFVKDMLHENVLLRPIGNTIYLMPPYSTSIADIRRVYNSFRKVFLKLTK